MIYPRMAKITCLMLFAISVTLIMFPSLHPWRLWLTFGVPLPHVGERWCMVPDKDPFTSTICVKVQTLANGWVRVVSLASGVEYSSEVWIFRTNYRPEVVTRIDD